MESTRQKKVARLLQKELSDVFQRDVSHVSQNSLLTITIVRISPDLSLARVYFSVLPSKNASVVLMNVEEHKKSIRQHLASRIRHQVRIIPELSFYLDNTEEEASKIDSLLANLQIPPAPPSEDDEA
jgi:ribosome-binding factor A